MTATAILETDTMAPNASVRGRAGFQGRDLLALGREVRRRGSDIAMIFQDPVTSLNPVLSIERLMTEGIEIHMGSRTIRPSRAVDMLQEWASPKPQNASGLPASVLRQHAPAGDDRHGPRSPLFRR